MFSAPDLHQSCVPSTFRACPAATGQARSLRLLALLCTSAWAHASGHDDCPCLTSDSAAFQSVQAAVLNVSHHNAVPSGVIVTTSDYGLAGCSLYDQEQPYCTSGGEKRYPHWCAPWLEHSAVARRCAQ